MHRTKIKNYAPQARRDFLQAVTDRAAFYGLTERRIEPVTVKGDVAIIAGRAFPRVVADKRKALRERVERDGYETELVLPESLLHSDSIVRKLVSGIDEEDWQEVEIIGWLYEAYISERYEDVIGSVVASADIPAATQRFTPKWIVRYL